jgi:AraC-like DNA-binding protein
MSDRPEMHGQDPLSDVLGSMRVTSALATRIEAHAPWGWRASGEEAGCITFVLLEEGAAHMTIDGNALPEPLRAGDVFILFDSVPYTLSDHAASALVDCTVVESLRVGNRIRFGGEGERTVFCGGTFAVDQLEAEPILTVLPRFLHLNAQQVQGHAFRPVLELLSMELAQQGLASASAIVRLYELLFVHAVRAYAGSGELPSGGWLAAVSDLQLGRAARAMHSRMDEPWTLQSLAQEAAMSRSAFAARFKAIVGQTPLDYLTHWRMRRARQLMRRGTHTLQQAALEVGYDSPSAFSRVFKRVLGISPGAFRRRP